MSAFMVHDRHIDALLTFASDQHLRSRISERLNSMAASPLTWSEIGRALLQENARSIKSRYNETVDVESYEYRDYPALREMSREQACATILKACQCYDYQACETDNYEESAAHAVIRAIEYEAIHQLPSYENAPWEITD